MRLDYVLALKVEDFLERRLQTQVFKTNLAKSIHHARVLIRQRHIRYVHLIFHCRDSEHCIASASKSSTSHRSSSVLTPRSTSTSLLHRHTEVDAPAASSANALPLQPSGKRVARRRRKSKFSARLSRFLCHFHIYVVPMLWTHAKQPFDALDVTSRNATNLLPQN